MAISPTLSTLLATFGLSLGAAGQAPELLVSSRNSDEILRYDGTGAFLGSFASGGGLDNPVGLTFGPDGNLYVVSANTNEVLRYDGATGAFVGVFASAGLSAPRNLNFGPGGDLFVCNGATGDVRRFDAASGQAKGVFAQHPTLTAPTSMTFGPDGNLYVGSVTNNHVVRFDGRSGGFLDVFAQGGQNGTHDLSFGPDGDLYVSNAFGSQDVVRFDGGTGALQGVFVRAPVVSFPLGITWGLDGDLYLVNQGGHDVRRFDGRTGAFVATVVAARAGGLDAPLFAAFVPAARGTPRSLPPSPAAAGADTVFAHDGIRPGGIAAVAVGLARGAAGLPCPGATLGVQSPLVLGVGSADESGHLVLRRRVPAALSGVTVLLQPVDFTACVAGRVLSHRF
ncbi:MAG: NHL repeat-containing protein [Planctomycetota bacterium]